MIRPAGVPQSKKKRAKRKCGVREGIINNGSEVGAWNNLGSWFKVLSWGRGTDCVATRPKNAEGLSQVRSPSVNRVVAEDSRRKKLKSPKKEIPGNKKDAGYFQGVHYNSMGMRPATMRREE